MGGTSLTSGWVPWLVYVLTPVVIVLGLGFRHGVWKRQLVVGAGVAVATVLILWGANSVFHLVPYSFPFEFYLWTAPIGFALGYAIAGWRADSNPQRAASVVAVVLTAALLGVVVNGYYSYYPTVDRLFGKVAENEVGVGDLGKIAEQSKEAKALPPVGQTVPIDIPSTTAHFEVRQAYVYLPPIYFADPSPELPVMIMLHGVPGGPDNWERAANIDHVADEFAAQHEGKAPILVMPDLTGVTGNDTLCADSKRGNAETYLTVDVPTFMRDKFHAKKGAKSLGIAGYSTGGFCALALSVRHPDIFTTFGAYGAETEPKLDPPDDALKEIFDGNKQKFDEFNPTAIVPKKKFDGLSGWFEAGADDPYAGPGNRALAKAAMASGMEVCLVIRPGGHDFRFWEQAFRNSLPWFSGKLDLIPPPPNPAGAECGGGPPANTGGSAPGSTAPSSTTTTKAPTTTTTRRASTTTSAKR